MPWDHDSIKGHLDLINQGTDPQLVEREQDYLLLLKALDKSCDLHHDMRFLLRKLREEKAARLELRSMPARMKKA